MQCAEIQSVTSETCRPFRLAGLREKDGRRAGPGQDDPLCAHSRRSRRHQEPTETREFARAPPTQRECHHTGQRFAVFANKRFLLS